MTTTCQEAGCDLEVHAKVEYNGKWLCLKHFNELGDFDRKGKMSDGRIKR